MNTGSSPEHRETITYRVAQWVRRLSLVTIVVSMGALAVSTFDSISPAMTPPHYPPLSPAYTSPFAGPALPSEGWNTLAVIILAAFAYWLPTAMYNQSEETP